MRINGNLKISEKKLFECRNCEKHLKDIGKILYIRHDTRKILNIQIIGECGKISCQEDDLSHLLLYTQFNKLLDIKESKLKELIECLPIDRVILFDYVNRFIAC